LQWQTPLPEMLDSLPRDAGNELAGENGKSAETSCAVYTRALLTQPMRSLKTHETESFLCLAEIYKITNKMMAVSTEIIDSYLST
jgi:hypothetical protein